MLTSIFVRLFRIVYGAKFRSFGKKIYIIFPRKIEGIQSIEVDDDTYIDHGTKLAAVPYVSGFNAHLKIGKRCRIGARNHIYSVRNIIIEDDVLTGPGVYISDNSHDFQDHLLPIMNQSIKLLSPVKIGSGAWLGSNVCVIGASVGRNSVIGANSVVLNDVPDYSVAVGSPARVIKRFNEDTNEWERVR